MSLVRLLAALLASVLMIASAVALDRGRDRTAADGVAAAPSPSPTEREPGTASPSPGGSPTPTDPAVSAEEQLALLTSTEAAADAGAEQLLAAALAVAQGPWRDLTDPAWPVRNERPVYVAEATIGPDGMRVEVDVVVAWRTTEAEDRLVLRALPASRVLEAAGAGLELDAELDGEAVDLEIDREGARLLLQRRFESDEAHLLRLRVTYDLVDSRQLAGDGGPAGFGILARSEATETRPTTANLGHWLPLLTFDEGAMIEWGDVGGFPVAIWSVLTDHPGALVTGGADGACPDDQVSEQACTWSRGVALRDVSAVWFADEPRTDTSRAAGLEVNAVVPAGTHAAGTNQQALLESAGSVEVFAAAFGPLAWREFDVVAAPLLEGAAGMEFPGLVIIDLDVYGALNGRVGTYVIAHEVAHQWFHALVGNGSLSDPVVDEAIAQYLSYLFWARAYGEEAADRFVREAIRGRYVAARQRGLDDEPPAQPLGDFEGNDAYSPLVYARAPLAFVAAEERIGRQGVVGFLAGIVEQYGLAEVSDDQLLEEANAFDRALGGVIERYWFDPAPLATDTS